ncbi:mandelate racemase/muconate lactonizing enzyme family protein [Arthrobacter ruber]|uniref:mandelate racemase/muconate lactonizing enzyme family protein n=1 Tax=Arthrobacter ruber TaxID=1258893 RepID=UPI000CF48384|nr:mandelate racemase/muconate lactonizing enzyme family protein [Arthrobacter ruber]
MNHNDVIVRIRTIETLSCDAGWRNYHFLKLTTDEGTVGWSEFDEDFGPRGLSTIIELYAPLFIGADIFDHERTYMQVAATARPAPLGLPAEAFGAIENAMLDAKAKLLGIPVHQLLGGKHRDNIPVYWSHCASWRISHPDLYGSRISDLAGVKDIGREARDRGFKAVKTNMFSYGTNGPKSWGSGFGNPYEPGLNIDLKLTRDVVAHVESLREGVGEDVEILLDLNFNARTEGFLRLLRALNDIDLFWVELDLYNPEALAMLRSQGNVPIASCETLFGVREFLPYLINQSIDVGIVDVIWNGAWQAMKIANTAEAFDVNVAPHNFYSHLATMMSANFAAAVPNLRIMEHDVDRLNYDDDLFTHSPVFTGDRLQVTDRPGWGTEPIEEALRAHPAVKREAYLGIQR